MIWPIFLEVLGRTFSKITFPNLYFLKGVSVTMIANKEKMKMKKSHLILVCPTDFLKKFLSYLIFWKLYPTL